MPSIFVVGSPRTGTTLVKEILNRHPRVHLFDEVHFFERIWDDRGVIGDLANPLAQTQAIQRLRDIVGEFGSDPEVADVLTVEEYRRRLIESGRKYSNLLRILLETGAERHGAEIWGDSSPQDVLYLSTILDWFPDARIVGLVRDPRGYLSSCKNYYRRNVDSYVERAHPVTQSLLWRSYMSALLEAEAGPRRDSILRLRYEDLTSNPEDEVRRMCDHVGIDFDPVMLEPERANTSFPEEEQGAAIFRSSVDRWKEELTPTEIWIGERIFGEIMGRFGYTPMTLENGQAPRPAPGELMKVAARLPVRAFNHLFRSQKPVTLAKFRRVLGLARPGRSSKATSREK